MPQRLDILHINTERNWRGGEQQTLSLVQGLRQQNIACGLVCQPDTELAVRARQCGVSVFEIPMHGEADFRAALKIRAILKRHACKLAHCHTSHAQALGFWASCFLPVKRLTTRRVAFSIYRHDFMKINAIKYKYMTDHYVAISENVKLALVNDGLDHEKISVVYSGVDPLRFAAVTDAEVAALRLALGIAPEAKVLLNAAHLSKEKGQDVLLAALPAVIGRYSELRLVLAGGGDSTALRGLAAELGVAEKVIFAGFRQDVGTFYKMCDIFVLPSLSEGLGTAALDALALQKPIIVSAAGGLPEVADNGKGGRVVPPGDSGALADAIISGFDNITQSGIMARHGYENLLRNFTLDSMVAGNLNVYRTLQPLIFQGGQE